MKMFTRVLVLGLVVQTSAFAMPMAERLLSSRAAPTTPSSACADFSGTWEGSCKVGGQVIQNAQTISQNGCDSVTMGNDLIVINGLKSENLTLPMGAKGVLALAVTQSAQWETSGTELAIRYNGFLSTVHDRQQVEVKGAARLRLNNGQLAYEAEILGVTLSCLYDKK